jgi:hypothetical protein
MSEKPSLFEFFGLPVSITEDSINKIKTTNDRDTYDRDELMADAGSPDWRLSTIRTFADRDTYDNDVGVPGAADLSTSGTRTDRETYDDDPGLGSLGTPQLP